jgi:hypothetical protein
MHKLPRRLGAQYQSGRTSSVPTALTFTVRSGPLPTRSFGNARSGRGTAPVPPAARVRGGRARAPHAQECGKRHAAPWSGNP